ncbi:MULTISPECIES: cbb3-type cytochrome c oxidase N-terminal domain-containing protein [Mangrovimonas]|uniref:cbb3-type cytochrome c oxidase N-terminal domain-containing protein n=1 Tax=Mangrovimonas TaxID=1211036 RepID=UPI0006B68E78|nr:MULTISPECIES: cbb3-type cytochrome c oxidase N-terminal domain-containing protein [Mangrovimonas]MCF1422330.1 c-type cytochrome [Mangrovimonas futianensis]NIK92837.1 c-type cytochrome [Mangrovimonas sp. CR14]
MRRQIPGWIRVPVIFFAIAALAEYFIDSGNEPAFIKFPMVALFLVLVLMFLIGIEAIVSSLENILFQSLDEKSKETYLAEAKKPSKLIGWIQNIYKKSLDQKPIEEEHEIILDHNYDGIKELDNSLPPWWLYSFYASIIFAAIYLLRYHVFNGANQFEELEQEYAEAQISIEEYKKTAKDLVDFNTVEILTDASDLNAGKVIFQENCVACHKADGGGGIGPNLTDEYWILGGGIKNVFHTISEGGRAGKGMVAWKQSLKPSEMAQVASYVLSLQGTTPAEPKEPQGDIWTTDEVNVEDVEVPATIEEQVIKVDSTDILLRE